METLLYYLSYFLHLLFGAIIILGFFAITRGWKEIEPDGSEKWKGKIFKGWFIFWFQEWPQKLKVYYQGREFHKLMLQINRFTPNILILDFNINLSAVVDGVPNAKWLLEIEEMYAIRIETKKQGDRTILFFYKEAPNYVFPWWVRDMLAGCITCHSSWLGSLCFWIPYLLTDKLSVHLLFNFTGYFGLSLILTWIAYCISLAFVTTALWKKYM